MTAVDVQPRLPGDVAGPQLATRCAVVVVNYGSHELLMSNLVPLQREDPGLEVVVVDNFTSDEEAAAVHALGEEHGWAVVARNTNLGFGAGVNRGAEWAFAHGAQQILLLNPDATIRRADLAKMQERVLADPMTMVAPTVRSPGGKVWFGGAVVNLITGEIRSTARNDGQQPDEIPWLSGACVLVSRTLWERVGGFDEGYFLYWEDVDLSYRVLQAGGRLDVMTDAAAVHEQGGTQRTKAVAKSDTYYYHMVRNRLLFAGTHLGRGRRARWVANSPKYAWRVVLHGGRRQLLHSLTPLAAVGHGVWDGTALARRAALRTADDGAAPRARERIIVLQSVPGPRPTTNPYNVLLADALAAREDADLRMFSWKEALLRRQDVFHAHWPEAMITRRGLLNTCVRQALFFGLLVKWRINGTTVVRTVHNLDLPSGISRRERFLLRCFERQTSGRIRLNDTTEVAHAGPVQTIVHGHYRPWFDRFDKAETVKGRLAYFGMIRRYKGVPDLVSAFHATQQTRGDLTLAIGGMPSSSRLADELVRVAEDDPRIDLRLEFLDTDELVKHIGKAELVVLPHTDMHNSGSAIAALSLDRPVLMQDNAVNRQLSMEVGPGWIYLYQGKISENALCRALADLRADPPSGRPDLSARGWPEAADLHLQLYRASIAANRGISPRLASNTNEQSHVG